MTGFCFPAKSLAGIVSESVALCVEDDIYRRICLRKAEIFPVLRNVIFPLCPGGSPGPETGKERDSATAASTSGGFGQVVAALFI
jgi:hypothetical protein